MSRVANNPVPVPDGVEIKFDGRTVRIKGKKGELSHALHPSVVVAQEDNELRVKSTSTSKVVRAIAGTTRALLNNMVTGVTKGYERKLEIVGTGYRAAVDGNKLNLTLGFSHPVKMDIPAGITVDVPSQTEIVIKGIDKHQIGQLAANIRAWREPEPYKGKGVRYANERILRKEAKKA